jgi:two-component system LytT family response regulator
MKVLLIDDEAPARERLRRLLETESDVLIVGECEEGVQAVEEIVAKGPDLIFLDIQMPGLDGFGVLRELPAEARPLVVFATAFDEHAIKAFEAHAFDYLLKPFRRERLQDCLNRARQVLRDTKQDAMAAKLESLLRSLPPTRTTTERLIVKDGARISIIPIADVVCPLASGNYVEVCTSDERRPLLRETMSNLEARLDPRSFFRANRSALVSLAHIREIVAEDKGTHILIMDNGAKVRLTAPLQDLQSQFEGLI